MKMVVLSDIHIDLPFEDQKYPDNLARLEAAIDRINTAYSDADLVVFAGDLVDRGRFAAPYEAFKDALSDLSPRYALTVGNHDDRGTFCSVMGKAHCDENGYVQSAHTIDGTHVIVLDSAADAPAPEGYRGARAAWGQFCAQRLERLKLWLQAAKGQPVIVILHHPPRELGIWGDDLLLREADALVDMLVEHGNVRQVISGHIHRTTTAFHRGIPFTTLAGGCTTVSEDFGRRENRHRRSGPAQMAVVLSDSNQTTVHFDNYCDEHRIVVRSY
ncbi:MAG: metallophosphoesterase [Pseudomonadota bacterium]|nr:metallophosphoesterase [Pseudomonadota bacterium]